MSDLNKWKKIKNSGYFKRKTKCNYLKIINNDKKCIAQIKAASIFQDDEVVKCVKPNTSNNTTIEDEEVKNNWTDELENCEENEINDTHNALNVRNEIRTWANKFNIRQTAIKSLINILNSKWPKLLPQDPRTLLKTPQEIIIWNVGQGKYWHQGFRTCIDSAFANISQEKEILININMDGIPTYKSSKDEFWPILFNIHGKFNSAPMVIGIYYGKGKPRDLHAYLSPFVQEMKQVLEHGIYVNGFKITVKIRCFICDSPARAFIKGVSNFNSQHGCQKCTTVGEYSYDSHCNIFPRSNCEKRTDASFRSKIDEFHHKQDSPLLDLPIDMVQDFVVADSLHLVDLGIMKRCLLGWRDGSLGTFRTKWSARDTEKITLFLLQCKMPIEIHRTVRGLDCLSYWKALEYRTFLYYIGIVILRHYLPSDVYEHFLSFFCAITICSSDKYRQGLDLANTLLEHYVEIYRDIYGECYITSNVHNLTHLVDDVRRFGILSSFSAYPFENKLYQIKNLIRTGNNPLVQVAKRLGEIDHDYYENNQSKLKFPILKHKLEIRPMSTEISIDENEIVCYSSIHLGNITLDTKMENKWFLTKNNEIVAMKFATKKNSNTALIHGKILKNTINFFETPIKSCYLNIYESECEEKDTLNTFKIIDIKSKLVAVQDPKHKTFVFIPLLHTLV